MCGNVCGFNAVRFVASCATAVLLLVLGEPVTDSAFTGLAPLFLTVSDSQLHTISAVGAGLLIGTALGVILPEGSEAFRAAQEESGILHPGGPLFCLGQAPRPDTWIKTEITYPSIALQVESDGYLTACLELS